MALIKCPECGKEISDKSEKCIHCGYSLNNQTETEQTQAEKKPIDKKKMMISIICLALVCVIGGGILIKNTISEKNKQSVLSGEVDKYLNLLGDPDSLEGTSLIIDDNMRNSMNDVAIGNYEGAVTYFMAKVEDVVDILGYMQWISNDKSLGKKDYDNVVNVIEKTYGLNKKDRKKDNPKDEAVSEYVYWENVGKYSVIAVMLRDDNDVKILWAYDTDNLDEDKIAEEVGTKQYYEPAKGAILALKDELKNPDSLQIHEIAHSDSVLYSEKDGLYGIRIDFTAQNGFGGSDRDYYYALVDENGVVETVTTGYPELHMLGEFTPIDISDEYLNMWLR